MSKRIEKEMDGNGIIDVIISLDLIDSIKHISAAGWLFKILRPAAHQSQA